AGVDLPSGLDLRSCQAIWAIAGFAKRDRRIELALRRILEDAVDDAVERVALRDGGFVQHGVLLRRQQARVVFMRGLPEPNLAERLPPREVRGGTGDDGVEIQRIALCGGERLTSACRAAVEVGLLRRVAVVRRGDGFRRHR